MSAYKAPIQEFSFILEELVDYNELSQRPGYQDVKRYILPGVIMSRQKILSILCLLGCPMHLREITVFHYF